MSDKKSNTAICLCSIDFIAKFIKADNNDDIKLHKITVILDIEDDAERADVTATFDLIPDQDE